MDTDNYIQEAERQLGDTNFYVETESDMTEQYILKIGDILKEMFDKLEIGKSTYYQKSPKIEQQNSIFSQKYIKKKPKVDPLSVVMDIQQKNLSFRG